jgi:hypothetical protein
MDGIVNCFRPKNQKTAPMRVYWFGQPSLKAVMVFAGQIPDHQLKQNFHLAGKNTRQCDTDGNQLSCRSLCLITKVTTLK